MYKYDVAEFIPENFLYDPLHRQDRRSRSDQMEALIGDAVTISGLFNGGQTLIDPTFWGKCR